MTVSAGGRFKCRVHTRYVDPYSSVRFSIPRSCLKCGGKAPRWVRVKAKTKTYSLSASFDGPVDQTSWTRRLYRN